MQVYSLISSLNTYHPTLNFTPGQWTCSFVCHFNSTGIIQRGDKLYIFLKILHQVGFESAREAVTSAKRHTNHCAMSLSCVSFVLVFGLLGLYKHISALDRLQKLWANVLDIIPALKTTSFLRQQATFIGLQKHLSNNWMSRPIIDARCRASYDVAMAPVTNCCWRRNN